MGHKAEIYEKCIKRLLDIVISILAIVVMSPIMLVLALLVRLKLGSPVIFCQERPGKNEKIFKMYKFRSMLDLKDSNNNQLSDEERLTKFGRVLRSTSMDELPEFFNILKGDMSLVGPRPLLVEYLPYYTSEERHRHDVRPGLTGWAQVNGRNAISSWEERFAYDLEYVNNISILKDIKIVLITIQKVIKKSDIQVGSDFKLVKFVESRKNKKNEE